MRRFAVALLAVALWPPATHDPPPSVEVLFSPRGGCTARVVAEVDAARESVRVQAYGFTSRPVCDALARAHARGVSVEVILDARSNADTGRTLGDDLAAAGVAVLYDGRHAIAHNKLIVVDGTTVVGGSFNFTAAAETSNAENLTVTRSPSLAARYLANYAAHRAHATPAPRRTR